MTKEELRLELEEASKSTTAKLSDMTKVLR